MKNKEVVEMFVLGGTSGRGSNLKIEGDNLINYQTIIARRINDGIVLNNKQYSVSTRTNQNHILRTATDNEVRVVLVENEQELKAFDFNG